MAKGKSAAKHGATALDRSPSHLLHRALQRALDIYADEFGADAITQRQYAVLAAAAEHEGATQADLVRSTGIDRSTLADMATRMIAKGLLERERSTLDARANAVSLTEAGRTEERIAECVQDHIAIRMRFDSLCVRDTHATQHDMVARPECMDIVALADAELSLGRIHDCDPLGNHHALTAPGKCRESIHGGFGFGSCLTRFPEAVRARRL